MGQARKRGGLISKKYKSSITKSSAAAKTLFNEGFDVDRVSGRVVSSRSGFSIGKILARKARFDKWRRDNKGRFA